MVSRSLAFAAAGLTAATMSLGCGSTDTAVFVEVSITEMSASVTPGSLGTNLSGGFRIALHLGDRASGPSDVTLEAASLTNAAQTADLVAPLPASANVTFPVTVQPDSDVAITITFDTADKPLPLDKASEICGAGGLRIALVMRDSLQSTSTPAASEVFVPVGCP